MLYKKMHIGFAISPYIKEMRVKSWLKNVFVFVPIVFAQYLTDLQMLTATGLTFAAFCLVSSAIYIYNDVHDAEKDAMHPVKCSRPIASGALSKRHAMIFAAILAILGLVCAYAASPMVALAAFVYLVLNIAYTLSLKHRPIYDCFCIAAGFVLRVFAGGVIAEGVSDWLFLTVVAMSLFMAFGKRRGEMLKSNGSETRSVLEHYDLGFLNAMMYTCAGLAITFYSLWAMWRGMYMIYTVPLIIFIVCKYLLLLYRADSCGDPTTMIFENKTLLLSVAVYGLLTVALLYADFVL